jgi:sigma-B regulation protein RsbU (phosphoserine phosphatase)
MGTFPDHMFAEHLREYRINLGPGDMLLQYTDGLNESMNEIGEQFSLARILSLANEHAHEGAESLIGRLVRAETAFRGSAPQSDDLTLLAVSVKTQPTGLEPERVGESKATEDVAKNS